MFVRSELSQSARNGYAASGPSFTCHATQPSTKSTLYTLCTRVEVVEVVEVQAKKTRKQVVIRPLGTSSGICSDALAKAKVLANVSSVAQRGPKTAASPAVKTFRIYAVQPSSVQCIAINMPKIPKASLCQETHCMKIEISCRWHAGRKSGLWSPRNRRLCTSDTRNLRNCPKSSICNIYKQVLKYVCRLQGRQLEKLVLR